MFPFHRSLVLAFAVAGFLLRPSTSPAESPDIEFSSPVAGSTLVLPETNIILRPGGIVDEASITGSPVLLVTGSSSGPHEGTLRLSEDRRTLTFQPTLPFEYAETVRCVLQPGIVTDTRRTPGGEFSFTIAGPEREALRDFRVLGEGEEEGAEASDVSATAFPRAPPRIAALAESLPEDFPAIHASVFGTPAPGRLFLADLRFMIAGPRPPSYLMILNDDGSPYFYRQVRGGLDFKMQPDGRLTYFDSNARAFYAMNARYDVVDSFRCGNGFTTDNHDLVVLPNGHALLMSYDPQRVDLTAYGGRADAIVIGLILQELDLEKNVVFQWRSWDHFQITDVLFHSLTTRVVDYVHGNSVDADPEGNLIISCRHMNEVTKISRTTGEILWRMGGRNNQFTFTNDPIPFSHQHDVRRLPNGNLTIFDNGNFRVPVQFSRALEYAVDETAKTATLVWQQRLTPDVFGGAFGSVQRLPNGNTLVSWGATNPTLTEVRPDGFLVSQLTFDPGIATYRAFRFEWPPIKPALVTLGPDRLISGTRGAWIYASIQPVDANFVIEDIELSTIRLAGTVAADTTSVRYDMTPGMPPRLTVRFPRSEVNPLLTTGTNTLEVSGSLATGERFLGSGPLILAASRVQSGRDPITLTSKRGTLPVVLQLGDAAGATRSLGIYDIQGRLIWRRPVGADPGGRVAWDGRDSNGRRVGSGIYLIRVEGAPGPALKVAVVR